MAAPSGTRTEYYLLTQRFDWSTQIANAKFANCHNPAFDGYIELCKQTDPDNPVTAHSISR